MQCDRPEFSLDPGPAAALSSAVEGDAFHRYDDTVMAERSAQCYEIRVRAAVGALCLDAIERVPLYLALPHPFTGQLQVLEATHVEVGSPTGLERAPVDTGDEIPLHDLDLPDGFTFECADACTPY